MKRVLILATLALFGISTLTTSCIVSKKKYNTAVANGRRSLDSLNRVFNKTVEGFNQATNSLKTNNSSKDITLDSLIRENQKLAGDKATLNQNLINSINEFNEERAKLARKTRTADSLMNILALQSEAQDSIRNLDEGRQHELETMLMTINKALTGINQSDAKAKIAGPGVIVTISNDYLYKTAAGTEISTKGATLLAKLAAVFTLNENCRINVVAHTDNNGTAKALLDQSARKAAAVITTIAENSTLPGTAYTASGRGMYNPEVTNTNDANKKQNRRTEIVIIMK
ncbi:MAG: OmpA family protein [Bacteroidales bacterium]|nr:OmpA family protein [Bacteroidales bacterium]